MIPATLPTASPRPQPAAAAESTLSAFVRSHTRVNQRTGIRASASAGCACGPQWRTAKSLVSTPRCVSATPETPWPEGDEKTASAQRSLLSSRPHGTAMLHPETASTRLWLNPRRFYYPPYGHMPHSEIRKS